MQDGPGSMTAQPHMRRRPENGLVRQETGVSYRLCK
jgi:hypothetical protein